jgi:3-dehydrotetronate 4-kinase
MLLGVIADDFTGGTDIAGFLVENGMRTIQLSGVPSVDMDVNADAVVISLKSRSCPVEEAVAGSLGALKWLSEQGCEQYYFKYCSTFDSTANGNIGPVTDALLDELGEKITIVCPALPVNGRTVFNGHLFVMGELLSDSGMRNHPVTPMTDSSLLRLMDLQSRGESGLIPYSTIDQGADAVVKAYEKLGENGNRYAVVDAFTADHLETLGESVRNLKLVTGGSGLAVGIAKNWQGSLTNRDDVKEAGLPKAEKSVILSGSCSQMTNLQVKNYIDIAPHFTLDVASCVEDAGYSDQVCGWVLDNLNGDHAPIVYATAETAKLQEIQNKFGAEASSQAVEHFFSQLAARLQRMGVKNFIVAGGETSGVVTQSLGVNGFRIGPQIAPGVPWVKSLDGELSLALKSGNFGDPHFFTKAQEFFI